MGLLMAKRTLQPPKGSKVFAGVVAKSSVPKDENRVDAIVFVGRPKAP